MFFGQKLALGRVRTLFRGLLDKFSGAAAAYSLRKLSSSTTNVVRVRRASDNDEKDFTASQIESGEMVNWVNSQTVPPLDIGVETSEGRTPVPEGGTSIGTPAAAYSLRNLSTTYTGNVVDVRRSSDDAEESFTAEEVSDGTLEAWVSEDTTQYMQFDGVDDDITGGFSLLPATADFELTINFLVNSLPTSGEALLGSAAAGTGRHNLQIQTDGKISFFSDAIGAATTTNSIDTGKLNELVVERSAGSFSLTLNGGTTATIVDNGGSLKQSDSSIGDAYSGANFKGIITSLSVGTTTWDGSITGATANGWTVNGSPTSTLLNDGTVSKWYDQSGNDNHAVQTTPANQPTIVEGGSLVTGGIDFDGVDDTLNLTTSATLSSDLLVCSVLRWDVAAGQLRLLGDATGNADGLGKQGATQTFIRGSGASGITSGFNSLTIVDGTEYLFTYERSGGTIKTIVDGTEQTSDSYASSIVLDAIGGNTLPVDGKVEEIIIYDSDQSDNRTAIEANIGETYGITGIPAYDNTVDGFVETWYDQSGNGNDATQSVAGNQPKIVDGGSLVVDANGMPEIHFDGTSNYLDATGLTTSGQDTTIFVAQLDNTLSQMTIVSSVTSGGGISDHVILTRPATPTNFGVFFGSVTDLNYAAINTNQNLHWVYKSDVSENSYGSLNGVQDAINAGTDPYEGIRMGANRDTPSAFLQGSISEVIVYDNDQSATRTAIEGNINAHYNIYP